MMQVTSYLDPAPDEVVLIADVAVTKRHQRLDKIKIIFTRTAHTIQLLFSKKLCHAIYALDT